MMDIPTIYSLLGVACALLFLRWRTYPLRHIRTIGPALPIFSYVGALKFAFNGHAVLQEGYDKYKVFKIALVDRWLVVVSGADMNEELCRFPDDQISFELAAEELVHTEWTIQPDIVQYPIHVTAIKQKLTRNLAVVAPAVVNEVQLALDELIPAIDNDWLPIAGFQTVQEIVARASNRVFVGEPLCRNKVFLDVVIGFSNDVVKGVTVLTFVPSILQPIVGPLLPWPRRARRRIYPILKPMLDERRKQLEQYGEDWADNPARAWSPEDLLVQAVLGMNFAALHTSTVFQSFTHALFHLAASPEYTQPLREEVESVLKEEGGWTKAALGRMVKIDSFIKESQRLNGVSGISLFRRAIKDLTLSDGTCVPAGTILTAIVASTHHDENNYENADAFDPFRFSRLREQEDDTTKHQYVSTSGKDISFGHGRHACPGRFFVSHELKIMLANIVLKYDVKFQDGRRPENEWATMTNMPSQTAQVLFRKRTMACK
ncbi:cytochrome P450 [Fomitopsis serialis]|uniref:cytochrome P450 n=1 Tax=Fomitopsis serialis TaxID=139415 RepID=UPI002008DB11|nr:cytochrome P450 [Neoantrodia serialis]KAH9929775.1 cytochrome P450 [Neoantrodia serialis]